MVEFGSVLIGRWAGEDLDTMMMLRSLEPVDTHQSKIHTERGICYDVL